MGPGIRNRILRKVTQRLRGELALPVAAGELTAACKTITQGIIGAECVSLCLGH